jgi:anti-sigma factor (TIGR02949 family)
MRRTKTKKTSAAGSCDLLVEQLSAYLDGDLGPAVCARIRRHSMTCTRCAALIDDLQQTVGICRRAGQAPLPAAVRSRARTRMRLLLSAARSR